MRIHWWIFVVVFFHPFLRYLSPHFHLVSQDSLSDTNKHTQLHLRSFSFASINEARWGALYATTTKSSLDKILIYFLVFLLFFLYIILFPVHDRRFDARTQRRSPHVHT